MALHPNRTNFDKKGECSQRTKDLIARYYLSLLGELCPHGETGSHLSVSNYDMFHNAICFVLQDSKTHGLKSDDEIMGYIRRRVRNVMSEVIQDDKQLTRIEYGEHIQAKEKAGGCGSETKGPDENL